MKIIILGAGQVGGSLAEQLIADRHDITLVDNNQKLLDGLQDRLDLRTVLGHGSYPSVLKDAGADSADMLIAVTDNDELNIVACQVAYSLFQNPTRIARIRARDYVDHEKLFGKEHFPIDVIISPEQIVTSHVQQLIAHPGALQVLDFANGRVKMVVVKPFFGGELLGKKIGEINQYLPEIDVRIVAIFRHDRAIIIDDETVIEIGDEIFFISASEGVPIMIHALCNTTVKYHHIMIAGGGNIGSRLAGALENNYQIKLIDIDRNNCEMLSQRLHHTIVLCGDCCDKELLVNENIEHVDVFCAVTNDDEDNIIACLQAKRLGAKQVMALITRTAYVDLIEGGKINIAISPQLATVGSILAHLRRGDIVNVHSLRRGAAEAIEVVAHGDYDTSRVVGRSFAEIELPKGTTLGALVRGENVIIPKNETVIEAQDHIILFVAEKKYIHDVEKMFEVSPEFI